MPLTVILQPGANAIVQAITRRWWKNTRIPRLGAPSTCTWITGRTTKVNSLRKVVLLQEVLSSLLLHECKSQGSEQMVG